MEEARRVMERLERIEALQRADAPAAALLAEVRKLLAKARPGLSPRGRAGEMRSTRWTAAEAASRTGRR
jgi:hypothetical protein